MVLESAGSQVSLQRCADLVILSDTPKGRGVFATKHIPSRTIIDVCPVLVVEAEADLKLIERTCLNHYTYNWSIVDPKGHRRVVQAVVFGLGSMFNHSREDQNVGWERDAERGIITYRALRLIKAGEELCISYGGRLTFVDADDNSTTYNEGDGIEQLNQIQLD
ncbi:hypothetical protein K491DRAFT_602996 [Lophiostoma macrostomum CBS 122681]|uniref:SET domain-containing protein n=1 Tax=Lophiostoma macrostomum CBS 122681 TaxID=1314788 RepID=A0A6A6T3B8_9PLEO|nr:hypothetical protein K491DRAFT_602996 [Lophiostoma macrostomum CBS 122681]